MKRCGSCFRYVEDWRDSYEKDLRPRYNAIGTYYFKPRKGVKANTLGINCPKEIKPEYPACKYHSYRWVENIKVWYTWHFKQPIKEWYRKVVRVPLGRLRKPMSLKWEDYYSWGACRIVPKGAPVCPYCGEMPDSLEQCAFCGQRFEEENYL